MQKIPLEMKPCIPMEAKQTGIRYRQLCLMQSHISYTLELTSRHKNDSEIGDPVKANSYTSSLALSSESYTAFHSIIQLSTHECSAFSYDILLIKNQTNSSTLISRHNPCPSRVNLGQGSHW